jgi:hypothetical protein
MHSEKRSFIRGAKITDRLSSRLISRQISWRDINSAVELRAKIHSLTYLPSGICFLTGCSNRRCKSQPGDYIIDGALNSFAEGFL